MNNTRYSPTDIVSHLGDLTHLLTPYEGEAIQTCDLKLKLSGLKLSDFLSPPSVAAPPAPHTNALHRFARCSILPD